MAKWTELSYNKSYSRNKEIKREVEKIENVENVYVYEERMYGIIEDYCISNCYAVEDVYSELEEWN